MATVLRNDGSEDSHGGGIYFDGSEPQAIINTTIANNTATGHGGGVYNDTAGTIFANVTIANNRADSPSGGFDAGRGGGIYNEADVVTLRNSILYGNTASADGGQDCYNDFTTDGDQFVVHGANVIGDALGAGDFCEIFGETGNVIEDDPMLDALSDNGGAAQGSAGTAGKTLALLEGSPAIDAAVGTAYPQDQRGFDRDDSPDLGAFEYAAVDPSGDSGSSGSDVPGDVDSDGVAGLDDNCPK